MATNWVTATVIENRQLSERHYSLVFDAKMLPFKAGQFARLQLKVPTGEGEIEALAKPYSLINSPEEKTAEVYFNTVPEGKVSHALAGLRAGDHLEIAQPCVGFFVLSQIPQARHLWMLATGTGLGPYLSMLKTDEAWKRFERIVLVHAVPFANELHYAELIGELSQTYPEQFRFISVVSREDHNGSLQGRIPALIENGSLEAYANTPISTKNSHVLVCGNSGLLNDTKAVLKERGMERHLNHKPGHVSVEQYY